jgi:hypothetical protein
MADIVNGTDAGRTPTHLWIVGGVSALWNAFGAFDYVMTQTRNEQYLAQFTADQRAYFDSFPAWMEAAWACGVWGALLGSLLLLARSRYAVAAFGVSIAGLLLSTINQFVLSSPPEGMASGSMMAMNVLIWVVAVALLVYSMRMHKRGVLR